MCPPQLWVPLEKVPHALNSAAMREHWESQAHGLSLGLAEWSHPSHPHVTHVDSHRSLVCHTEPTALGHDLW